MANQLPEVVPEVRTMPTTGWFCQTSGTARRRVTKNSGTELAGIYDVAGVPGHTHNASAVISADADYTRYRTAATTIGADIWGYGPVNLPVGMITDSVEPDHAAERYDRAIERCVGSITLTPENCTGFIREPTRSISEIRTLVAPKARLDTLTYMEERRGWVVPDAARFPYAAGAANTSDRDMLVSDFPDVYLDVRPLVPVGIAAALNTDVSPSSLYMNSGTHFYKIVSAAPALGDIGTYADGSAWDGTLRFVWDDDRRLYRTLEPVSVTLDTVLEVTHALPAWAVVQTYNVVQPRLTVEFPVLETTQALDGHCWFTSFKNEEALSYALATNGLVLSRQFEVEVLGVQGGRTGPFTWVGMPAYRIPVGSQYAHPAPEILPELNGALNHTHWDKFRAFDEDAEASLGFLTYQQKQQQAEVLHAAPGANQVETGTKRGKGVFDLLQRSTDKNGGMFHKRSGGILSQAASAHYDAEPNFDAAAFEQYEDHTNDPGNVAADTIQAAGGLKTTFFDKDVANVDHAAATVAHAAALVALNAANAAVAAAEADLAQAILDEATALAAMPFVLADLTDAQDAQFVAQTAIDEAKADAAASTQAAIDASTEYKAATTPITYDNDDISVTSVFDKPGTYGLKGSITFDFTGAGFTLDSLAPSTSDQFCVVPGTPLLYQKLLPNVTGVTPNQGFDFNGDPLRCGKVNGNDFDFVPQIIMNCRNVDNRRLVLDYDFTDVTVDTTKTYTNIGTWTGQADGQNITVQGYTLWTTGDDSSIVLNNQAGVPQVMRNKFRTIFRTGNKFSVPAGSWKSYNDGGNGLLVIYDYLFALDRKSEIGGLYFETAAAPGGAWAATGKVLMFCPGVPKSAVVYEAQAGVLTAARLQVDRMPVYILTPGNAPRRATHVELNGLIAQNLDMYVVGPDWWTSHVQDDPYAAIRKDSSGSGAVYQSVKRISQHVCAPVLNPNTRIEAQAPLNHDSRHLPPELRDFRLELQDIDWGRLQASAVRLNELTLYEFKGGNQKQGAEQNILYMPEFREFKTPVTDNTFEFECYSNLGSPSYFCLFCRSLTTDILQQPLIRTLSIFNQTTQKKSNSIRDLSIGQLYHLTQRNVHPFADYNRSTYNRRQTILLSAEDVGLLGLKGDEYQKAKRVNYVFSGTTDRPGQLYVVFVYNNRGLHIDGRRLHLVSLHE